MEITKEINDIASELLERYKQGIKDSGHYASGALSNNARTFTKFDGKYFEIYFTLEEYWKWLENGTKPHFPPISKIEEWIKVKPVVPQAMNGKVPSTKQLAFLIARSISIKGTKPTKILQNTLNNAEDLISRLYDEITKQLEQEIDKEL